MAGTYRYWLICLPELNPQALLLFTENDVDGGMIRDYSAPGRPREVRRVFLEEVPGVFRSATRCISVDPHRYADDRYWRQLIQERTGCTQALFATTFGVQDTTSLGSKGSKYQIQRWVNERPEQLTQAICGAFPPIAGASLQWVSPLSGEMFREYQDDAFLKAIGQHHLSGALAEFWPKGGPVWDALAVLRQPQVGVVLIEAKAYPEEAEQRHCRAEGASLARIKERLDEVKQKLGADMNADWLGSRYQVANRLAYLSFLRSHRVPAWYVQICFCDDVTHRPTSEARWRETLPLLWKDLGLSSTPEFVTDLLLPAFPQESEIANRQRSSQSVDRPAIHELTGSVSPRRSILDGTDRIISAWLGIPKSLHWRDRASITHLVRTPIGDEAVLLVEGVIDQIEANWDGTVRGSGQNWRWVPCIDMCVQGGEVGLQKSIVKNCGPEWVNAIPTASGLMAPPWEEKQRNIDLGRMRNDNECELIELKLAAQHQHPLAATIQLFEYACLYLHARQNSSEMATVHNAFLMRVDAVRFQVLSERSFYHGVDWRRLERTMHDGLAGAAAARGLTASFQLTCWPEWFSWTDSNVGDLLRAVNGRAGLHGPIL